jgi:hypothetical protein
VEIKKGKFIVDDVIEAKSPVRKSKRYKKKKKKKIKKKKKYYVFMPLTKFIQHGNDELLTTKYI